MHLFPYFHSLDSAQASRIVFLIFPYESLFNGTYVYIKFIFLSAHLHISEYKFNKNNS